jgi:hypothetical protein
MPAEIPTSITTLIVRNTKLTCKTKGAAKVAKASGSMMRSTAKALLTGIKGLLRSTIGERLRMLPNRENLSVATRIREDRIYHEAAGIVPANQASPIAVGAIALLEGVSGAVKRGNRATVVVQAVKAHRQEGAVVPEVVAAEEAEEAMAEVGAPAAVEVDAGN